MNHTIPTVLIMEQQEVDGLVSQARSQYGQLCVNQHELGATLLKIRDAVKAQGSRTGKGFEAYLADIGISKTQAYRFMRAAETGEPIDYDNEPSKGGQALRSVNGTKLYLRLLDPRPEWISDEHLTQLLRLPDLVNPDPKAPEYKDNIVIAGAHEDPLYYIIDQLVWGQLFREPRLTASELERRVNQYAYSHCYYCLFHRLGKCVNCLTAGRGFLVGMGMLKMQAEKQGIPEGCEKDLAITADELKAVADYISASFDEDEDEF